MSVTPLPPLYLSAPSLLQPIQLAQEAHDSLEALALPGRLLVVVVGVQINATLTTLEPVPGADFYRCALWLAQLQSAIEAASCFSMARIVVTY